jgi:ketosteroid isomerase-like protein
MPRVAMPAVLLAACAATTVAAQAPPAPPPDPVHTDAECEVWARELSFADALAAHDQAAFAEHVHPQAAFGVSRPEPLRTRDTIAEAWRGLVEGEGTRLLWYPTRTTISPANPDIAWSTGPALFENLAPDAEPRYTRSQYTSLWMRDADGTWRVLFDDGTHPRPVTEAEAAAFRAGRRDACPRG